MKTAAADEQMALRAAQVGLLMVRYVHGKGYRLIYCQLRVGLDGPRDRLGSNYTHSAISPFCSDRADEKSAHFFSLGGKCLNILSMALLISLSSLMGSLWNAPLA